MTRRVSDYRISDGLFVAGLVAATLAVGSPPAGADVTSSAWNGSSSYTYEVMHMPDFDQRRQEGSGIVGLPGDGGMYCVPTATMNLFAYAANHGYPFVSPGPGAWQLQSNYNDASMAIFTLGVLMNTNPNSGTNGNGTIYGASIWAGASGILTATQNSASGSYCPTLNNLAWSAIDGGIVAFAFGRYDVIQGGAGTVLVGERTGGHMVTLARAARSGSSLVLESRDPADDPDSDMTNYKLTQSPFGNNSYNTKNVEVINISAPWVRTMTALNWDHTDHDGKIRLIDSYLVIKPLYGLTFVNTGTEYLFLLVGPLGLFGDGDAPQYTWPDNSEVIFAALGADQDSIFVITDNPGGAAAVQRYDMSSSEVTDVGDMPGATDLVLGRQRQLYVLGDDRIQCIQPDEPKAEVIELPIPLPCMAMAFDDVTDQLYALSTEAHALLQFDKLLQGEPNIFELPGEVDLGGEGAVAVSPAEGLMWMISEASDKVYGVPLPAGAGPMGPGGEVIVVSDPLIVDPTDVSVGDDGHVLVATLGKIVEIAKQDTGEWLVVPDSVYADQEIGRRFQIVRSRTNYDPETHPEPAWNNVDPDDLADLGEFIPDCPADLNLDGQVDAADLATLLGAWGTNGADLDGNGATNAADLAILLGAWGPCP